MQPKFDVFISYSRTDSEFADSLYNALTSANLRIWMDRSGGISGGAKWEEKIRQGLKSSQMVLVVISQVSMKSKWVDKELGRAEKLEMDILPVQIEGLKPDADYRMCLDGPQWIDARKDQSPQMLAHIVEEVRQLLEVVASSALQREDEQVKDTIPLESGAIKEASSHGSQDTTLQAILNSRGRRESRLFNAVREGATDG